MANRPTLGTPRLTSTGGRKGGRLRPSGNANSMPFIDPAGRIRRFRHGQPDGRIRQLSICMRSAIPAPTTTVRSPSTVVMAPIRAPRPPRSKRDHDLRADGIAGQHTLAALNDATQARPPSKAAASTLPDHALTTARNLLEHRRRRRANLGCRSQLD
jgi:hypothetical protein